MQLDNRAYEFMKQAKQQGISKEEVFSLLQSKGYDLGLNAQQAPQQTAQPSQDNYSALDKAKYIGRAAGEGLTFGLGDIVGGLTNTLVAPIGKTVNTIREGAPLTASDFNPIQNFKEGRGDFVREQQQFAQEHPVLNFGGELGGGLITGAAGAGKKLITAAGKQGLKALAKEGAREGAKFGLAYGAGSGLTQDAEKLSVSNALKGGAEGLVTGAALGAAVPVAVTGTGRGVQRFLGTKGYAQRAADEIFKEAGGKEIGQVVRTEKGTRALKEAIKADDKVARAVRDVSDQKLIDSADKTKDIINNTLGVDNIVNARNQARAFYDDVVNNSTTKIPQSIYSNKGTQEALAKAIAEDYSGELAKKGPNSLAVAQKAKEKLDDMIEASYEIGDYGVRKPTSKTQDLIAVKNAFVKQLDAIAPEYKMARDQFTKAVKPYDLLEGLTKTTGRERANTIKSVLTNKNKEAISSVFGKEKAGQLFDTLRAQSIENERFNKLYNAAENKLTRETPLIEGGNLLREAWETVSSFGGSLADKARLGGMKRGRRRIGEILLGMGEKEATRPNLSVSGILANKLKEEGGYAMKPLDKTVNSLGEQAEKLLKPRNLVSENFVSDVNNVLKDSSVNNFQKIEMGQIPWVYIANGLEEQPLRTNKLAIRKAMGLLTPDELKAHPEWHNHNVPKDVIDKMPELIADPLAIFKSNTEKGKYVAVLDAKVKGDPVVAIISPGEKGGYTFMPTSYERHRFDDFVKKTQKANNVVYVDTKRSSLPHTLTQAVSVGNNDPTHSIATKEGIVKGYFDNLKRFSNKSQIVDENGKPLVMYHNTTAEPFDTFDVNKIGSSGSGAYHGAGFNFASHPNYVYGKNEIPVYLNAKNVLSSDKKTITRSQLKKMFLEADKGRKDTLVGDFSYQYAPYGSAEYNNSIDKAVDNLISNAESDLDIYSNFTMGSSLTHKETMNLFKKLGFDGAVEKRNGKVSVAVVFDPKQIKSVYNKGTFSKKTPNIYKSIVGGLGISQILRNQEAK